MIRIICIGVILAVTFPAISQNQLPSQPPYKRFPTVPPLKLLLTDSSTVFTKENLSAKKATMIMLFSPDCDHCQQETEQIIRHKDAFQKVQIIMATTFPFGKMLEFYKKYNLSRFDNIVMGKEINFMLPTFLQHPQLPLSCLLQ